MALLALLLLLLVSSSTLPFLAALRCYTYKHVTQLNMVGPPDDQPFSRTVECAPGVDTCMVYKGSFYMPDHYLGLSRFYYDAGFGQGVEQCRQLRFCKNSPKGPPYPNVPFRCGVPASSLQPLLNATVDDPLEEVNATSITCLPPTPDPRNYSGLAFAPQSQRTFTFTQEKRFVSYPYFSDLTDNALVHLMGCRAPQWLAVDECYQLQTGPYDPLRDKAGYPQGVLVEPVEPTKEEKVEGIVPPPLVSVADAERNRLIQANTPPLECDIPYRITLCTGDLCNSASHLQATLLLLPPLLWLLTVF